jgi:hypothetical protein
MNKIPLTLIAVTTMLLSAKSPVFAVTEVNDFLQGSYYPQPYNTFAGDMGSSLANGTDLALNRPTTLSTNPETNANGSVFVDGQGNFDFTDNFTNSGIFLSNALVGSGGSLDAHPVLTINLNINPLAGGSVLGYSLSSINSVYAFYNHLTLSDQQYTVSYNTVFNSTYVNIASVSYDPFDNAAGDTGGGGINTSLVQLTDLAGINNVKSVRFTFSPLITSTGEQSGQSIQDIGVFGVATPEVPEPTTWALLGFSALFLLGVSRRKLIA